MSKKKMFTEKEVCEAALRHGDTLTKHHNASNSHVAQLLAQFQQRLDKIEKVHTEQIGELSSRVVSLGIEASRVDDSLAALIEHFGGLEADYDELDGTT